MLEFTLIISLVVYRLPGFLFNLKVYCEAEP